MNNRGLTVLHISWAYQILASKTADNRGLTVTVQSVTQHSCTPLNNFIPFNNHIYIDNAGKTAHFLLNFTLNKIKLAQIMNNEFILFVTLVTLTSNKFQFTFLLRYLYEVFPCTVLPYNSVQKCAPAC